MLVSHREIVACYHNGTDVHRIIARRVKYIQGAAIVAALVALYLIKSALGINLVENYHAIDLLTLGLL